jgi:hypothetical protein
MALSLEDAGLEPNKKLMNNAPSCPIDQSSRAGIFPNFVMEAISTPVFTPFWDALMSGVWPTLRRTCLVVHLYSDVK